MSKQRTKSEMYPLIASWESSTQDRKEFCDSQELTLATFCYWRTKYLKSQQSPDELFTELQPAIMEKIEIIYPSGVKVSVPKHSAPSMIKALIVLDV